MNIRTLLATVVVAACDRATAVPRAATRIPVGDRPVDVVAADLDGDGAIDLVSADAGARTLSVRLRRAGGWRPGPGARPALDAEPHLLATADLDGDGDRDLVATAHDRGGVYAWLNDGAGGFRPAAGSPRPVFVGPRPHNHGLAVADLDGDGDDDVVVADQGAAAVAVAVADGRGGLVAAPPIPLPAQPYPIALGDLDRNGRADLVAPLITGQAIAVLRGDGGGGFAPVASSPVPTARPRPYAVALCDLDRDGALDAVVTHDDDDALTLLRGDGVGGLAPTWPPVASAARMWRPTCADVDGDGALDVVGAAGQRGVVVLRGDGHGGLRPGGAAPGGGWTVVVADLDRDGRSELISPDPDRDVIVVSPGRRR